jgi:hypothetical protein
MKCSVNDDLNKANIVCAWAIISPKEFKSWVICITVREDRIICCQIFCNLLIKSAFERIFNVMQLILVKLGGILSKNILSRNSTIFAFHRHARDPRFELFRGDCVTDVFDLCLNYLPFWNLAVKSRHLFVMLICFIEIFCNDKAICNICIECMVFERLNLR